MGSFNPVHDGHFLVANYLIENDFVDKVLLLPTPGYWHKTNLASVEDRINMLKLYETNSIIVDDVHNNYPFTYQVLNALEADYPDDSLFLIIGSDNLEKFHLWNNLDDILKHKVIVMRRGSDDIYKYLEKFNKDNFIIVDCFPYINVSSTEIRHGNYSNTKKEVCDYIRNNKLY